MQGSVAAQQHGKIEAEIFDEVFDYVCCQSPHFEATGGGMHITASSPALCLVNWSL